MCNARTLHAHCILHARCILPRFLKARVLAKAVPFMRQYDEQLSHYNRKPAYTGSGRPALGAATGKNGVTIHPADKLAMSSIEENMEKVLAFMLWSAGIMLSPNDSGLSANTTTASMSALQATQGEALQVPKVMTDGPMSGSVQELRTATLASNSLEELCALPPTRVHYFLTCHVCKRCFASTAVRSDCDTPLQCLRSSSACSQQERQLGKCLVARSRKEDPGVWPPERTRFVNTFSGRRVAVVGDSMGRQSFSVLVSLLRGEKIIFDSGVADTYAQVTAPGGSVVDLLGMAHVKHVAGVHFPPDPLPRWGQLAARAFDETSASLGGRGGGGQLNRSSLRLSYVTHQCYTYHGSTLKAAVLSGTLDLIVLHSPAYWPLLGMCGASHNRTADIVRTLQRPGNLIAKFWAELARDVLSTQMQVLVVNAPTEKIGLYKTRFVDAGFDRGVDAHAALEAYQQQVLANSTQHPPRLWAYVDWASLMREKRYPGAGSNESDWHYACGYQGQRGGKGARDRFDYSKPPEYVMITPRGTSLDCLEQGNTALYRELVLPQLERWWGHVVVDNAAR